jgi:hypothetical protein
MHHQVGAERDGLLQRRREERVVGHEERAGCVREPGGQAQVGDAEQRIARRLNPH